MKREIINYPEFLAAAESIFPQNSVHDIKTFTEEAVASKQRRKSKITDISSRLKEIKTSIETYKIKIKQAASQKDKKEYGLRLNQFIRAKREMLKIYKESKNLTPFSELSREAKTYFCTHSLLKKYLFEAFIKSSPEAYHINKDNTVTLNVELFRNSILYQQAQHIKDYVESYIEHYPNRVCGGRYFVGLHKDLSEFDDIVNIADEYFENINQKNKQLEENLLQSRKGIEVIEVYPEYNVQLVKLTTDEALKYEGTKMSHCVSSSSTRVKKGETEIYSIRDIGDEYTEFAPHATIELRQGKISQIKGYSNGIIDIPYIKATRQGIMLLLNANNEAEILNNPNITQTEKYNIGLLEDTTGNLRDILASNSDEEICFKKFSIKANRIKYINFHKKKFINITITGEITPKTIKSLRERFHYQELSLKYKNKKTEKILDLSSLSCKKIRIEIPETEKIILPPNVEEVHISGDLKKLYSIEGGNHIHSLFLHGSLDSLTQIPIINNTLEITSSGNIETLNINHCKTIKSLSLTGVSNITIDLPPLLESLFIKGDFNTLKNFPPSLKNLLIKGDFNTLNNFNSSTVNSMELIGNFKTLPFISQTINSLSLTGKFPTFSVLPKHIKKLKLSGEFISLHSITNLQNLEHLTLSGKFPNLSDISHLPSLLELNLTEGNYEQIKSFDFSTFPQLNNVHFHQCNLLALEKLTATKTITNFGIAHNHFPKLTQIDLSSMPLENFGILEKAGTQTLFSGKLEDEDITATIPLFKSYSANFTLMPSLQEIKLREDIKTISFIGVTLGTKNPFDFKKYKKLEKLILQYSHFPIDQKIDLSQCETLKELAIELEQLPNIIPPQNIEKLNIRKGDTSLICENLNLAAYKNITELNCDFIPNYKNTLPKIKKMSLHLTQNTIDNIKEIDASSLEYLSIKTSSNIQLPVLENIALPQNFEELFLFNVSPKLTDIDLRKVNCNVKIMEINYYDEIITTNNKMMDRKIYLHSDQFSVLKTIKLGKETELTLSPCAKNLPITIEVPADMPLEKEKNLKNKYPNIKVVRTHQTPIFQNKNTRGGR